MENRKNTILLTVIAVATLLVAVVGATFAYFTAQGGGTASTNVRVETSTSSNSSFEVGAKLFLQVNQDNLAEGMAGHVSTTDRNGDGTPDPGENGQVSKVNWTPSTAAKGDALNFCYTVDLIVNTNEFEYIDDTVRDTAQAAGTTIDASFDNTPELLFTISKQAAGASSATQITGSGITGLKYVTVDTTKTGTRPEVSGWDITEAAASTYNIPGTFTAGSVKVHQIVGTAGQLSTDTWTANVTMVNLSVDQQHNTDAEFNGTLKFTAVSCTDGSPLNPEEP